MGMLLKILALTRLPTNRPTDTGRRATIALALVVAGVAPASAETQIPRMTGSLAAMVSNARVMRRVSRRYRPPSPAELQLARRGFEHLVGGRLALARPALQLLGFDLFVLEDRESRTYHVVRERPLRRVAGWGLYVFNPRAETPLVFEAPHARHDRGTGRQAIALMERLGAQALLMSTAYRCATPLRSRCSGRTRACSVDGRRAARYRLSDVAHTRRSIFQVVHEVLFAARRSTIFVQLHGFARRPGRNLHVILSDGTQTMQPASWRSNRLAAALRDQLGARRRRAVVSCNERRGVPLCGTDNVQGRQANGSPDPCLEDGRQSTGRFLHVEQSPVARRRRARYFEAFARGLARMATPPPERPTRGPRP